MEAGYLCKQKIEESSVLEYWVAGHSTSRRASLTVPAEAWVRGNMELRENERRIIWGKSRLQRGSREERNVIDAIKACLIGGANPTMTEEEMRLGKRLLRMIEEERG